MLNKFDICYVTKEIADKVVFIRKKKKIKLPDAIILATADSVKCDLMTCNIDDFKGIIPAVTIINPL